MTSLERSLCNPKSRFLIANGDVLWLGEYDWPNGGRWLVKYKNKYYYIVHDGTGNQFFHSHRPFEVSENRAKELAIEYDAWDDACDIFDWDKEEFEKYL